MNKLHVVAARAALLVVVCLATAPSLAAAQSLPSPWASVDIGNPALAGNVAASAGGTLTIDAAGADIWGHSDQFHFVYTPVSGDVDLRARIDGLTAADVWSKAGVMIRSSLRGDAAHALALVSAAKGVAFQRRPANAGGSAHTAGPAVRAPWWVRLVRTGTMVTAYASQNGAVWTPIGSDTIALGATAYVGVAVTSHEPARRTTATVSALTTTHPGGLPAGQSSADVGSPLVPGQTTYASGRYTITAGGEDIWGTADKFHYVYQPLTGDADVSVRIASLAATEHWSKAGVMIRESLTAGSRHAMALVSAGRGYAFQRRPDPGALSVHTGGGAGAAPGWVRLVRKGNLFEAYRSPDGKAWTLIGRDTIVMTGTVYAGIALSSREAGSTTRVEADSLRIVESSAPANRPPVVTLTSPAPFATFAAPATLTLTAAASDADGTVSAVEFFSGSTLLGRDTTAPYALSVTLAAAATYAVTALATDNQGAAATSPPVTVVVSSGSAPGTWSVVFQVSADHAALVSKYVLEIHPAGSVPGSTAPVVSSDLGKPAPDAAGEAAVDRSAAINALPSGSYVASVLAVGSGGTARSAAAAFTR